MPMVVKKAATSRLPAAAMCVISFSVIAFAGTGSPTPDSGAVTVADFAGRKVSFNRPVKRIVMIRSRDIYEVSLLLEDELPEKLVAWGPDIQTADRDAYDKFVRRYPGLADVPVLGSIFDDAVSAEKVLALRPDLVIVETFMAERGYKSIDRMQRAGLPLLFLDFEHDPFECPQKSIELLGRVLGRERRAEEINAFVNTELDKVFSRLDKLKGEPPKVYFESGSSGPAAYGATYGYNVEKPIAWGTVMHRLRCRNIADGVAPAMGAISPEFLLMADPDVIVITGASWDRTDCVRLGYGGDADDAREKLRAFTRRPGWDGLKAVRSGRIYSIFHGLCMHTIDFAACQQLAKWFYPEDFADLNPEAALKEFHERFMPVDYSGAWMIALKEQP
ncbi:MAG TPA: ABC transporter substrate-binding protein [Candidatus Brocadiia bacterium]|nr:ABC transporter substrate-binding protein [Candidatus Brocadiia bacterium]